MSELSYAAWLGVGWEGATQAPEHKKGKVPLLQTEFLEPCTEAAARRAPISLMPFPPPPASLLIVNPNVSGSQLSLEAVYFSASLATTLVKATVIL